MPVPDDLSDDLAEDELTDRASPAARQWLAALGALLRAVPGVACPVCATPDLHYVFVGEAGTRSGFVAVWCEHCGRGFSLSRARAPAGAAFCSFRDAQRLGLPPDFVLTSAP